MKNLGYVEIDHLDKNGNVIWHDEGPNSLSNEGQQDMLNVYFRGGTAPAQFYFRLCNDTPVKTDTLANITGEPTTNGYAPQLVERNNVGWPTLAIDGTDYMATSKQVTFQATDVPGWGPVTHLYMASTSDNTGKHIAFRALSQSRVLANGESLKVTYKEKLMPSA